MGNEKELFYVTLANKNAKVKFIFDAKGRLLKKDDLICLDNYVGEGYSLKTEGMRNAVELFAREESILLDPVYTGKMIFGIIDLIKKDKFEEGSKILAIHTGGIQGIDGFNQILEKKGEQIIK